MHGKPVTDGCTSCTSCGNETKAAFSWTAAHGGQARLACPASCNDLLQALLQSIYLRWHLHNPHRVAVLVAAALRL